MGDTPKLFRVMLQVDNLDEAVDFYSKLLGVTGRKLRGSRAYFDCGSVVLAILDPTEGNTTATPNVDDLYFSVSDLEEIYERARELGCLSEQEVHNESAGAIVTRPWGERSFYIEDPWGNGVCFVDDKTVYTGR